MPQIFANVEPTTEASTETEAVMRVPQIVGEYNKLRKQIGELTDQFDDTLFDMEKVNKDVGSVMNGIETIINNLKNGKYFK